MTINVATMLNSLDKGKRYRTSNRRARLERMHAHFQAALPDMVPVYLEWERRRSYVPSTDASAQPTGEYKLRVINLICVHSHASSCYLVLTSH